jgi:RNA polymerase sigma factor (sigma-70 family)
VKFANQEEMDGIATEFIRLKNKAAKTKSKNVKQKYKAYQNFCITKFKFLVSGRVARYKSFSNYLDLEQDGYEALMMALKTYNPKKGAFTWWADKYITTRISRSANAHSTIKYPMKQAKLIKPFKTSTIPIMIDSSLNPHEQMEVKEKSDHINDAMAELSAKHRQLIDLVYGLNDNKPRSIGKALKTLRLSRPQGMKMLEEAKEMIKEKLQDQNQDGI